ncbi:MAG: hypothetical protein II920_01515 [Clostridia bacterium]|nr:hypothetical protein [Clostridia bacterium]
MAAKKTIYYTDELNDDFAGNDINTKRVPPDFKFLHSGRAWRVIQFILYYFVALPIVYIAAKLYLGLRFEDRKNLKKAGKGGVFLYGNHTRDLDAFVPALAAFPRRADIVCNPDAVSIPGLRTLVQMFGALPLPTEFSGMLSFMNALFACVKNGDCVTIYPEAHVWPFYTGIRPFKADSFCYPMKNLTPVVAMVTRYTKRRGLFALCRRPGMTVSFSEPFYPDPSLGLRKGQQQLRDEVYAFMCEKAALPGNVEYIHYVKKSDIGA